MVRKFIMLCLLIGLNTVCAAESSQYCSIADGGYSPRCQEGYVMSRFRLV